jgi:lysophospholipase L1-like esterase
MARRSKIGFTFIAVVLGFSLLELFARVAAPAGGLLQGELEPTEGGASAIMMRGSPFLLWELAPGERDGQGGPVSINSMGFRDRERSAKTGPRVLALGDSSVYGFGVGDGDVFSAKLEGVFESSGAAFINGGVPGYSSTQALNLLWGRGMALEPDLLLAMTLWSDNNFDTFVDADQIATYAAWRRSGIASVEAVLERLAIYRLFEFYLRQREPGRVGWMELKRQAPSGKRRVPIGDYARNLGEMCTSMAQRGGGVVFVILPNRNDLTGAESQPPWAPYREVMRSVARSCGAPVVDLPRAFAADGRPHLFLDEMHPSAAGHALMAATIADTLRQAGWPKTPIRTTDPGVSAPLPADPFEGKGVSLGLFGG